MFRLFLLLFLFHSFNVGANTQALIREDVYQFYLKFLNGRDVQKINEFKGEYIRRDVVDMILVQQALKIGGKELTFDFFPGKADYRNAQMMKQGKSLLSFDTYWLSDATELEPDVYISSAIIRKGEYFAGIFANPNNTKVFQLSKLEHFKNLTSVSTPRWRADWQTLLNLPLKRLHREDEWVSQARMVREMFVDFFMMPLNMSHKGQYIIRNVILKQVPNVALLLDDSRHFVISKKHPDGFEAYHAIQRGVAKMRSRGQIVKAYTDAGFFRDLSEYNVINEH